MLLPCLRNPEPPLHCSWTCHVCLIIGHVSHWPRLYRALSESWCKEGVRRGWRDSGTEGGCPLLQANPRPVTGAGGLGEHADLPRPSHTVSPGRPCVCTSGSKGVQGTGCLASRAPTAEGASRGAWLPGEQPHKKTSLGELTATRGVLSSGAVPGADLCPLLLDTGLRVSPAHRPPLGPLCARTALSRGPRAL